MKFESSMVEVVDVCSGGRGGSAAVRPTAEMAAAAAASIYVMEFTGVRD